MSSDEPVFDNQRARELIRLVRTPSLKRWRDRIQAANELGEIKADLQTKIEAARALRDVVSGGVAGSTTARGFVIGQWVSIPLAVVASILLFVGLTSPHFGFIARAFIAGFAFAFVWCLATVCITPVCCLVTFRSELRRRNALRAAAAAALGKYSRRIGLGVLTNAVTERNSVISPAARESLLKLLGRLKETDYGLITSFDMHQICSLLDWHDEELALAVLEVIRKAGTGAALPYVERAAQGKRPALAEAARQVLPILEARARQEADNKRLLRAAGSPDEVETLLRPAHGMGEDDQEALLRPSHFA